MFQHSICHIQQAFNEYYICVKCLLEDLTSVLPERYNHCDETWEVAFVFLEVGIGRGGEKVGEAQGRGRKRGGMEGELAEELRD